MTDSYGDPCGAASSKIVMVRSLVTRLLCTVLRRKSVFTGAIPVRFTSSNRSWNHTALFNTLQDNATSNLASEISYLHPRLAYRQKVRECMPASSYTLGP
jgi:hypothetical protein